MIPSIDALGDFLLLAERGVRPVLLMAAVAHLDGVVDQLPRLRARPDLVQHVFGGRLVLRSSRGRVRRLRRPHLVVRP